MLSSVNLENLAWFKSELVIFCFAAFGGLIVIVGLWMEYTSEDEKRYKNIDNFRSLKATGKRGEIIVMAGILVEIAVAIGFAARDDSHMRQIEINNNPMNQPISSVFAQVTIVERGTNETVVDPLVFGAVNLTISSSELTNFWRTGTPPNLVCTAFRTVIRLDPNGADKEWFLDFSQTDMFPTLNGAVRDVAKWDEIKLVAAFLQGNTEILGGSLKLTVNLTNVEFSIPPQKVKKPEDLDAFSHLSRLKS
jgi:hypothetical protein